ncbi:flagellar hook capping protein [Halobacteroides halobius DSM 5150]|uniref:Flagellar hook capping protein n=1 Tax=Halobacteroides halobius (strain ATCC 35273 / DSM 5150 / MD-1) TaxID=748449 RepID=L0K5S1_HALHC|nr:flagellar hook capping FlgD N-terminal domain-containing protein [Halobacteroides halobius]AGB40632.1 flagellar hook capping protein [Halobacteroides halobius DSM 5150]
MDSIQATQSTTLTQQSTLQQSDLGKDEFLKLLVTQLQNQNPMNPMKNKEFMGQMAQFNSLQQMQSLNTTMSKFINYQQLSQAGNLVGKKVKVLDSQTGQTITGEVKKVNVTDSDPQITVNGKRYSMNSIQEVLAKE